MLSNAGNFGGKTGLYFVDQSYNHPKISEEARCLIANYNAGITTWGSNSGVLEAHAVITPERMEKRQNGRRMKEAGEAMFTLTSQDRHGVFLCQETDSSGQKVLRVQNGKKKEQSQTLNCKCQIGSMMKCGRIRRLTPKECFRLQGFPDELYEKAAAVNSETQLYKQAGNAVTTTVAFAVAMMLPESRE